MPNHGSFAVGMPIKYVVPHLPGEGLEILSDLSEHSRTAARRQRECQIECQKKSQREFQKDAR